jgi:hypothetical protein
MQAKNRASGGRGRRDEISVGGVGGVRGYLMVTTERGTSA